MEEIIKKSMQSVQGYNISFVCIYCEEDKPKLEGMLKTIPSNCEIVLMEVVVGEYPDYQVEMFKQDRLIKEGRIYAPVFRFDTCRNIAKKFATKDWIFSIDADERLQIDQHQQLLGLIDLPDIDSFSFIMVDIIPNNNGVVGSAMVRRLFKKELNWVGACHEQIFSENGSSTDLVIRHDGHKADKFARTERNLKLMLQDTDNNLKPYWYNKIIDTATKLRILQNGEKNSDRR